MEVKLEMLDICEKGWFFWAEKAALLENAVDGIVMLVADWQGCGSVWHPWLKNIKIGHEHKRQILVSWKRMLLALLENVVDRIVMEWKRFLVSCLFLGWNCFSRPTNAVMQLNVRQTSPCSANLEVVWGKFDLTLWLKSFH